MCCVILARSRQNIPLLALTVITLVFVLITVLLKNNRFSSGFLASLISFSNPTCNYVCFAIPRTGNRLGNHLFYFAGVQYAAWLTGRMPCIKNGSSRSPLDEVFDLDIARVSVEDRCPVYRFRHMVVYAYNPQVIALVDVPSNWSILLKGSFASWMYTRPIAQQLRHALNFRSQPAQLAAKFVSYTVPPGWTASSFVRVGVHVRRGDFLGRWQVKTGFTTATPLYLRRALGYFVERFARIQFIVASNDIPWCREHIRSSTWDRNVVNITFSEGHSAGTDLAILASCDHTVMTTGTFGWWAAWLANGTTVYYSEFPRRGSSLRNRSRIEEYYPPYWIPIDG